MSYTQVVNHDPPIFAVGFAGGWFNAKDSIRNRSESDECTINIVFEHMLEAANAYSINGPYGISEWALSGLTPAKCTSVACSRVKESVFSIETKSMKTREFESRATKGKRTGVLAIIEGVRFWVREDAIKEERTITDSTILRPMSRLEGITYGRTFEVVELPRPELEEKRERGQTAGFEKQKADGQ